MQLLLFLLLRCPNRPTRPLSAAAVFGVEYYRPPPIRNPNTPPPRRRRLNHCCCSILERLARRLSVPRSRRIVPLFPAALSRSSSYRSIESDGGNLNDASS